MTLKKSVKKALLFVGSLMVACSVLLGDVVEVRADKNPKIGHHVTVSRINENDEVEVFEEYKNSAVAIYRLKDSQNICDASFERLGVSDLDLSIGKTAKPTGMGNNGKNVEALTLGEGTLICIYYKNQKDDYSLVNHFGIDKTSNSSRNYYITTYMSESNTKNWHWLLSNGNASEQFFFVIEIGDGEDEEPVAPPTEEEGEPEKIPEENEEPEEVPEEEEEPEVEEEIPEEEEEPEVEEEIPVEEEVPEEEEEPEVEEEIPVEEGPEEEEPPVEEEERPVEDEPVDEQPENTDNQDSEPSDEPESTPAEQPESTPAEQPENTPSEQPATEPVSQPATEPVAQPVAEPAPQIVVIAENPVPEVAIIEEVEASEPEEIEIVEEIVPLAPVISKEEENVIAEEPETVIDIPEEEVPMAVSTHCIIHWIVIGVALIYALYSSMRVIQNKQELTDEVETENNL